MEREGKGQPGAAPWLQAQRGHAQMEGGRDQGSHLAEAGFPAVTAASDPSMRP